MAVESSVSMTNCEVGDSFSGRATFSAFLPPSLESDSAPARPRGGSATLGPLAVGRLKFDAVSRADSA